MYLDVSEARGHYNRSGEQVAGPGRFLILVQDKDKRCDETNFRAIVRSVRLHQLGHWMMGKARVAGESITLSGGYGGDGLPVSVSAKVFEKGVPVPKELYDAWAKGGGWNATGNEAEAMRKWAIETFPKKGAQK